MPSIFDTKSPFSRSHSSPNIPELVNRDYMPSAVTRQNDGLPRSASYTCIPVLEPQYPSEKELHRIATSEAQSQLNKENQTLKKKDVNAGNRLSKDKAEERPKLERIGRRKSLVARPKSWIQRVKGSPERQSAPELSHTTPSDAPPVPTISKATREKENKTKPLSESFATFARKSWITSSRSPSPNRTVESSAEEDGLVEDLNSTGSTTPKRRLSIVPNPRLDKSRRSKTAENLTVPSANSGPALAKTKQRPQSVIMSLKNFASTNSSTSSLPGSSVDNRSTPRTSIDKVPPLPTAPSTERLQQLGSDNSKRRDELWSAFRSIENDFTKFQGKSWSLKTNVVRSSLLPFLRNHAQHPSNKNLRPEDLERRITILNKWWTGILEVLDGRQNQTVSGVDRPILLDACYAIMTRPEWRTSPSQFASLADRDPDPIVERRPHLPNKKSSGSLSSTVSQFMHESVHHNARNLFIQNLLTQMAYIVDKMSLRHAPASLVTFCGKATAYAFFFVPGVAEVLVRVWKLQMDVLRRVSDELGLPKRLNKIDTDEVIAHFPTHVHGLGWTSVKSMSNYLRSDPFLPVLVSKIPWYGHWVGRWCGRDSDLFFVFAKHYHVLAEEFLVPDLPLVSKARAPGFVLVQAQLLTALDSTIHRQPTADPLPITFDDVLAGADASAAALPLPSNNSARPMAENRLIMLLRDFISERPSDYELARKTFAESFSKMMQASAKRTSMYDHNACFVLCDFMEEALIIFVRFNNAHGHESDFVNWQFWLDVCTKMLHSENSMSEIRLFAFLFGSWNVLVQNERRKEVICMDWLLTEDTFERFFNHWCPMVRAYYMRLLCWRICRDDGEATDLDTKIFSVVSTRVKSTWAHYIWLKQAAEKNRMVPPSTAPCHPAPGRRLLIIRNDNQLPAPNMFLSFDGLPSSGSGALTQPSSFNRHSSLTNITNAETTNPPTSTTSTSDSPPSSKKRWTFMGKTLSSPFTGTDTTPSATPSGSISNVKTLEEARRETALARSKPQMHSKNSSTDSETPPSTSTHRAFSFKFSLEWSQHFEKPQPPHAPHSNLPGTRGGTGFNVGPERRLSPPRLPAAAQAWLGARVPGISREILPRDPSDAEAAVESQTNKGDRMARSKYAGRALAEWALIVAECNNFIERRRAEGVPTLRWVEVPTLGVEGFRKVG
ncbi:hypothetical protein GLAREA_11656 [Glarea lozoyensis ATCC 20868]|uniref:DUF1765-domain-containing protein n=1 Tax=Glarea lozoyensis (strain ATCC 20868 / MF5171) TaxID=1116229 RepID=S3CGQ5_GLAL2|nr:uncharacterized protein GLAREA_11656 [Glarea lozoyensis ATCC 20868]EPE25075.1 hypothetical protein GLAREA_11656 [Glarea lozoyensis ATCC 20868]